MTKMNIHQAKTNLSKLIELAISGEEVIITKAGIPKVKVVPIEEEKDDWFGSYAGQGWIAEDFDELPSDILAAFNGEDEE